MTDLCLLYCYHSGAPADALAQNWASLLDHNPGVPVIPLIHDGDPVLPGTVDVRSFPDYGWDTSNKWKSCDTVLYRWFKNRPFDAERYAFIEWDTLSTGSARGFYKPVWDAEVACFRSFFPNREFFGRPKREIHRKGWYWFRDIPNLPEDLRSFACGLAPWACTMFSHRALERMLECPIIGGDVHAELRSGTMAMHAGLTVSNMPYAARTISHDPSLIFLSSEPSLYHPVKRVISADA